VKPDTTIGIVLCTEKDKNSLFSASFITLQKEHTSPLPPKVFEKIYTTKLDLKI